MKKAILTLTACALTSLVMAQAPAFPGAEGVARFTTTGGRGGKVIHVTNLNDKGTGSLRAACTASGARIVVFDVSGVIELESQLKINNPDITIEGQTAPGDGICLKNYTFNISASNVIVRFIRCRMGDEKKTEDDAMNAYFKTGSEKSNVIIDHCSISWSTDECGSFYGIKNFTLQWCMLSESLRNSVHDKGKHGYGGIWGGENAAYHHNLLAHHDSRNPRFDHDFVNKLKGPVDFVNNVLYNWGGNSGYGGESCNTNGEYKKYNMVNNYYKAGAASSHKNRIVNPTTKCTNCTNESTGLVNIVPGHFYVTGNYVDGYPAVTADNWQGVEPDNSSYKASIKSESRFVPTGYEGQTMITEHAAETAFQRVLSYAGASYKRDAVDQRIAEETRTGTYTYTGSNGSSNGFIDTQNDVGGWPSYVEKTALTDSDSDGMPDVWETANGLNPNDASDAATTTLDPKGWYTNIEVYCNALVEDLVKSQNAGAAAAVNEYYPTVAKAEGVTYFDASVTAEGGYNTSPVDGAVGSIIWTFGTGAAGQTANIPGTISNAISNTTLTLGSELSYDGKQSISGLGDETKIKQTNANATSATEANALTFTVTPAAGYSFKATEVSFTATRLGTDRGKMDIKWVDSKTVSLATGVTPNRNNATPPYTDYKYDVSNTSTATAGPCSLVINIYELSFVDSNTGNDNLKDIGFANVSIKGALTDASGISTPVALGTVATEYYDLNGRRLQEPQRGINIRVERMGDGRSVTSKVIK